jgi:phage shock protein A
MRWLDRLTRLVRADAHGLLDTLEERTLLMRQHLREAELALDRSKGRVAALTESERRMEEEAGRLSAEVASLDEDVELALAGDKQELARFAAARLLPRREALGALEARREETRQERARLEDKVVQQESVLAELARRVRAAAAEERERECLAHRGATEVADEEVELELLRRRRGAAAEVAR